jgi:hypothetical protein
MTMSANEILTALASWSPEDRQELAQVVREIEARRVYATSREETPTTDEIERSSIAFAADFEAALRSFRRS